MNSLRPLHQETDHIIVQLNPPSKRHVRGGLVVLNCYIQIALKCRQRKLEFGHRFLVYAPFYKFSHILVPTIGSEHLSTVFDRLAKIYKLA